MPDLLQLISQEHNLSIRNLTGSGSADITQLCGKRVTSPYQINSADPCQAPRTIDQRRIKVVANLGTQGLKAIEMVPCFGRLTLSLASQPSHVIGLRFGKAISPCCASTDLMATEESQLSRMILPVAESGRRLCHKGLDRAQCKVKMALIHRVNSSPPHCLINPSITDQSG